VKDKDIIGVTWDQVRAFPEVDPRLKPTRSPLFPSKFCHFLLPRIFPVVDDRPSAVLAPTRGTST
jgi:hypothetical protein